MADLFFSYAHQDEDRVRPVVAALEARGWTVFWDRRIPAGASWRSHIGEALRSARCVLVAWSRDSITSRWVLEEADEARSRGVLLPILLDAVSPPIGFRSIQAADFTRWSPGREAPEVDQLFRDIEALLGAAPKEEATPSVRHRFRPGPRLWLAALVLLAVTAGGTWYLIDAISSRRADADDGVGTSDQATRSGGARGAQSISADEPRAQTAAPTTSRIAFISDREGDPAIFVMDVDGSDQRRLSAPGGSDVALAWSPDGRRIAFVSNRGGGWNLRVMNAEGGPSTQLGEAVAHERPAWSPDGNKLAFVSAQEGNADIYAIAELRASTRRRLTTEPSRESSPSWSPDGLHLAFTSNRDGTYEVYVMNADGTDQKRLTNPPTAAVDVAWSPDGRSLAYITRSGLFVMNADGSNARGLVTNLRAQAVSWSPDSRQLTFQGSRDKDFDVFAVNADGTDVRNLTRAPGTADYRPAWSPLFRRLPPRPADR